MKSTGNGVFVHSTKPIEHQRMSRYESNNLLTASYIRFAGHVSIYGTNDRNCFPDEKCGSIPQMAWIGTQ